MSHPPLQQPSLQPFHIAIIGAGIAGLTLAIGLHRQNTNISFTIYERAPTLSASAGAGIGLSPNAEQAMQLLAPEVHEAYERVANPNGEDWFQWVDGTTDELLFKLFVGKGCFRGCKRADFLDELMKCLPEDKVKFGKCLRTVREAVDDEMGEAEGEGGVVLEFEDGSCAAADAVIGCDGIHSPLRSHLFASEDHHDNDNGDREVRSAYAATYSHKAAFRALIPMDEALAKLGPQKCSTRYMYNGPGAHIITYPVSQNTALNTLVVVTDPEDWDKMMDSVSSSSSRDSSSDLTPPYSLPLHDSIPRTQQTKQPGHTRRHKHTRPATRTECLAALASFHPSVRAIAELLPPQLEKWAIFDMHEHLAPRYHSSHPLIVLAGDAAHAAGPHLGAAAGFGIEDACLLASLLKRAEELRTSSGGGSGNGDLPPSPPYDDDIKGHKMDVDGKAGQRLSKTACLQALFEVYTRERMERTQWLVQHTREIVDLFEWKDEEVARDPTKFGQEVTWRFHKVWYFDIEEMLARASRNFGEKVR
ncbi:hypothetical protein BD289DRAFT_425159 [Coniella lustricola]|uniref:FAD-binding domain-containing protein n=1 Tax=Coniella lustricola TaxID=2025994 RepID=A0A2T3AHM1_9PEZI|nr:hypothetical protein BD289DRAFT_425159 [Coniella lustricola]